MLDSDALEQNAVVVICREAVDQPGIDGQPRLDAADDFLRRAAA